MKLRVGLLASLCWAQTAHAQPRDEITQFDAPVESEALWQNGIASAAAIGLVIAGYTSKDHLLLTSGLVTFALASPTVHWLHGEQERGLVAFGLTVGTPLMVGMGADLVTEGIDGKRHPHAFKAGLLVGVISGAILDLVVSSTLRSEHDDLTFAIDVAEQGSTFAIGGTF